MALKQATRDGIKWVNRTIIPNQTKVTEDKGDYSLLRESSDSPRSEPDIANCPRKRGNIYYYLFLPLKGIVFCFAILGLYNLGGATVSKFRKPVSCSCGGTTVAEAKTRGCMFTPLALGWLPPQCLDLELSDEFDKQGPLPGGEWPYWADRNGTIPLSREEMGYLGENNGVFYTTQEWHIKHCMYTWRKHYRSKFTGITVEQRSNGLDHIHHCEGIMLFQAPLDGIWTKAGVELNADRG